MSRHRLFNWRSLAFLLLFAATAVLAARLLEPLASPQATIVQPVTPTPAAPPAAPRTAAVNPPEPPPAPAKAEPAPAPVVEPTPFRPDFKGPRVAVVLTEVGDNPTQARAAIEVLPPEIGLAFTPYPNIVSLAATARTDGHEVWVGLPMQPKSWPRVSPGKNTLLVGAPPAENLRRLDWALARVGGAVGVTGIMGSAFTESAAAMRPLFVELKNRNLAYLDGRASGRSIGVPTAKAAGVRAAANDRFLDESGRLTDNLAALERQAKLQGQAVGYARPLPATVAALKDWATTLEGKGILLVPPSTLTK